MNSTRLTDNSATGFTVTVLGCGGSLGVPVIGNDWGLCDPTNPKNRRTRAALLVKGGDTSVLIDTPPDIRHQLLREDVQGIDALLFTHHHADHTNGLDDLRPIAWRNKSPVDVYAHDETIQELKARFPYIFNQMTGNAGKLYKPFMQLYELAHQQQIGDLAIQAFVQDHHTCVSMGFRIGGFAYSTDVAFLDDQAFAALDGVDTWLVDCTRREPHPSHTHMERTLSWIEQVKPRQAYLTHMNYSMDYDTINAETPDHVAPAYDGMVLSFPPDT
ncbi:MAG: MBL fold metallo-hydrolase [Pseudomonadota bacterium]